MRDLSYSDPDTLPPAGSAVAPTSSPLPRLSGTSTGLFARIDTLAASQEVEWHVWDSTIGDETYTPTQADPTTLFTTSRSAVQPIERLPNGLPLKEGATYHVATWALNTAGYAPAPSAVVSGAMDLSVIADLFVVRFEAGGIVTGQIDVGFSSWSADNGLVFRDQLGQPYITLPADGVSPAQIRAFIVAAGITIEDNANLYGLTQMFGTMKLSNGITDPVIKAAPSRTWDNLDLPDIASSGFSTYHFGLTDNSAGTNWVVAVGLLGEGTVAEYSKSTGAQVSATAVNDFQMVGGITRIGTNFYGLGQDSSRGYDWYVYRLNSSWVKTGEIFLFAASAISKRPAIGNDGTDIVVAYTTLSGAFFRTRTYAVATFGSAATVFDLANAAGVGYDLGGVFKGAADFGAVRWIIQRHGGDAVAYTSAGATAATHNFPRAGTTLVNGLHWDGTRFRHLDTVGRIWDYATGNPTSTTVWSGYTWADEDTGLPTSVRHETKVSPAISFTLSARARLVITGQPAPDVAVTDPTKTDKANLLRIFAGPLSSTMRLQAGGGTNDALPLGTTTLSLESMNTGSALAPTTSGFAGVAGSVGTFESAALASDAAPVSQLKGDGSGRLLKSPAGRVHYHRHHGRRGDQGDPDHVPTPVRRGAQRPGLHQQ